MLVLLTLACVEYAAKKLSAFDWHRQFKAAREVLKKWAAKHTRGRWECEAGVLGSKIGCQTNSKKIEYGNLLGRERPNSGLTSGFSIGLPYFFGSNPGRIFEIT
jgi:hypothetical protein